MRKVTLTAAVLVLFTGLTVGIAHAARPDFSGCADTSDAFGQCVASVARDFRSAEDGTSTAASARELVEGCSTFTGEQFGECVSAAAQSLHDRGDEPGAAVSESARSLVEGCRGQLGREFGACVREAAHELGQGAGGGKDAADDDEGRGTSEPADADGQPAHHGKPTDVGRSAPVNTPPHGGKPADAGKPAKPGGH